MPFRQNYGWYETHLVPRHFGSICRENEDSMPLSKYGVLIGTLYRFAREDPNNFGSWYHGKIYLDTANAQFECAVDVSTPTGINVQYRDIGNLNLKTFNEILALSSGWHPLERSPKSGAIDYIRSVLFHYNTGSPETWIDSTGDNALDVLEGRLESSTRVFVFGAPYSTGFGVHDIHMNQGDPPGQFQHLDGVWQDGGTIVQRPDGELVAILTKFETQSLNTDENGLPV